MIIGEDMVKDAIKKTVTGKSASGSKSGKAFSNKEKVKCIRKILFGDGGKILKKELEKLSSDYRIGTESFNNLDNELSVINLELLFSLMPVLEKSKQKAINESGYSKLEKQLKKSGKEVENLKGKLKVVKKALS